MSREVLGMVLLLTPIALLLIAGFLTDPGYTVFTILFALGAGVVAGAMVYGLMLTGWVPE